jgi:APA family basic amino acid/polyamine antiporter
MARPSPPSRLDRRLGLGDAVVVGLGAMLGAGVFAAVGPAAAAAGAGLLAGLLVAAAVAWCNALSSAALAARIPRSGGAYAYGRERLGPWWGYLAGWAFVSGKLASCAAMALTFGAYAAPSLARPLAVTAVIALAGINALGVTKTVAATRVLVGLVIAVLLTVAGAALLRGDPEIATVGPAIGGVHGILQAAGLLFFAFAGYARIATLGEEVTDPARVIPRAIPLALGATLALYALVLGSALLVSGAPALATAPAPLARVVQDAGAPGLAPLVRAGAAAASLGVLLSLLAGVGRTAFAMAANADLPGWLAAVHPRAKVPHRAELVAGALVAVLVLATDLRGAIGFSSFCVLCYYAVANAAAFSLPSPLLPRVRAAAGLAGCAALCLALPAASIVTGAAVLAAGLALRALRGVRR